MVRPSDFQRGYKILKIKKRKFKIYLNRDWEDYKILNLDMCKDKHVSLQLIKVYDREALIDRYRYSVSMIPLDKLKIIHEVSSEYKQLLLENRIRCFPPIDTDRVYAHLLDIRRGNLYNVSRLFAEHLGIGMVPMEFSRRLSNPGKCHIAEQSGLFFEKIFLRIDISIEYMNDLKALAAIIAHEYTHVYRTSKKLAIRSEDREEIMTDISSIVLGFDELILQGMSSIRPVGYLTPTVVTEFCEIVDKIRRI